MKTRILAGATLTLALLACALLPAQAAPTTLVSASVNGKIPFWNPYPAYSQEDIDMAVDVFQHSTIPHLTWDFRWKDKTRGVEFVDAGPASIESIFWERFRADSRADQMAATNTYGMVQDPSAPSRVLRGILSVNSGLIYDTTPGAWPSLVGLRVEEKVGTTWVKVYPAPPNPATGVWGWLGTRTGNAWALFPTQATFGEFPPFSSGHLGN